MDKGLVSIVVPVYNAGKWIEDTILSVKSQTYKNWELLLVDDGSTDNSIEVMNDLATDNIRMITYGDEGSDKDAHNRGAAFARNTGITEARGRYICFIDADDKWKLEKLEIQIKFMQENIHKTIS